MRDLLTLLAAMVSQKDKVPDRRELLLDMADRIVKYAAQQFTCKLDEVAILLLASDEKSLRFVAPRRFVDLGTIPLTKADSIAVGVFRRKAGDFSNTIPMVKHVSFFESVKLRDRVVPIQKMVTVPILFGSRALGVAQISRKGDTSAEAGPDFTTADVRKAQEIFEATAGLLRDARPAGF
jgi:hypothetical protein